MPFCNTPGAIEFSLAEKIDLIFVIDSCAERPEEAIDHRTLYERLKEQKDRKQDEFMEQLKFSKLILIHSDMTGQIRTPGFHVHHVLHFIIVIIDLCMCIACDVML